MKKIILAAAATLLLATGSAFAEEAKAPANTDDCMKMLNEIGKSIPKDKVADLSSKGQAMAEQCKAGKYAEALATYNDIAKVTAGK